MYKQSDRLLKVMHFPSQANWCDPRFWGYVGRMAVLFDRIHGIVSSVRKVFELLVQALAYLEDLLSKGSARYCRTNVQPQPLA